jgi:hypothetical protein
VPDAPVQVYEVRTAGPGDVWFNGALAPGEVAVLHWQGERLARVPELEGAGLQVLFSPAPDDVWAAGGDGRTAHWDGTRWVEHRSSQQAACASRQGLCQVVAMWGGGSDVWAFALRWQDGAPFLMPLHWDGQRWQRSGAESRLGGRWVPREVRLTGPNEAWAFGERSLWYWDGSSWGERLPADASVAPTFVDVLGFGPHDVWALERESSRTRLRHWDGAGWSEVPTPEGFSAERLWGTSGSDVFAVGPRGLFHWDGREWRRELAGTALQGMGGSRSELFLLRNGGALRQVRSAPRSACEGAPRCSP